jgi:hypothetical protein
MAELNERQIAWLHDARELIDFLEEHPALIPPYSTFQVTRVVFEEEDVSTFVRQLGNATKSTTGTTGDLIELKRRFGRFAEIHILIKKDATCEKVVTTETVEITGPDPEAVAALPVTTRTVEIEKVEWVCPPSLLALAGES